MRFSVLALDYDGTIAVEGMLEPDVRAAVGEARALGITVLVVTGRILSELRDAAGDLSFLDAVVAENGAVVAFPSTGESVALAAPPPARLVEELRHAGVEISVGSSVVEAEATAGPIALGLVHALELPEVLLFNRDRMMILPSGVSKATGLREALRMLRKSAHNAIGIGDAENDHELLDVCELGVAVAWGSKALRARADEVIAGTGPRAVAAFIRAAIREPQLSPSRTKRRRLSFDGFAASAPTVSLGGGNLLIAGDPGTGKSRMAGRVAEQLMLHRYSTCVLDLDGDHQGLDDMPAVVMLGGSSGGPDLGALPALLRRPDLNVVVDLSMTTGSAKTACLRALLTALATARRARGVPHRIVIDGADAVLTDGELTALLDLQDGGCVLTATRPSRLPAAVLAAMEAVVTTKIANPVDRQALTTAGLAPPALRS
jgi:hydroxymethylpyrimidine pyrophosphatase-like HAD family hydrolase